MLRCVIYILRTFILIYSYTCVIRRKSQQKFGSINFKCKQSLMHGITRILLFTSMLSLLEYLLVSTHLRKVLDFIDIFSHRKRKGELQSVHL